MENVDTGTLLVLGVAIFAGTLGAWLFQRFHFPQVVGYIVIGLIIGESGLGFVTAETAASLEPINLFALGIIGFLVGGELQAESFRTYGRQFAAILFGEGLLAFSIVGLSTGTVVYVLTGSPSAAVAAGLVLGAVASATDPASTIGVLWENRSLGVMTTTVIAIVALDDALALTLYALSTSLAQIIAGGEVSLSGQLWAIAFELPGALALGMAAGFLLDWLMGFLHNPERTLALAVGVLLLLIATAVNFKMDLILASMALGIVLINRAPRRSRELFKITRSFSTPIYVLFFVLVGARLSVGEMPWWLWGIAALYVVGRGGGKILGAYLGARWSGAAPSVQRYTGVALFAQGGIAVGLSIVAGSHLQGVLVTPELSLGDMVVFTITATTIVVQLLGPPLIQWAVHRAGEAGRDVTEEDIIGEWKVSDVMLSEVAAIPEGLSLDRVIAEFTAHDRALFPVVGPERRLSGFISLECLKEVLGEQETWQWLVARDVLRPVQERVASDTPLKEALRTMREMGLETLFVTAPGGEAFAGILEGPTVRRTVKQAVIQRKQAVA